MTGTEDVTAVAGSVGTKVYDEAVVEEAIRLIDAGLRELLHRELVSTDEVADLLLDVRMVLTSAELSDQSLVESSV